MNEPAMGVITIIQQLDWWNLSQYLLVGFLIIFGIWLVQKIIALVLKRKFSKSKYFPKGAINGILLIVRIISAFIVLFVILSYFGLIDSTAALSFTGILSTAIGFSSIVAIGNFIAGIYIIASRPYLVGDFIKIGNQEGFIVEIGLNYTKIKDATTNVVTNIPNRIAMNENLLVYRLEKINENIDNKKLMKIHLEEPSYFKYLLFIEVDLCHTPQHIKSVLTTVLDKWGKIFGYPQSFFFMSMSWRVRVRIPITAEKMSEIQANLDKILDDIWFGLDGGTKRMTVQGGRVDEM